MLQVLSTDSLESETHGTLIPTVDLGQTVTPDGLMPPKPKYPILATKTMVPSLLKTATSNKYSTISKSTTFMTTGLTLTMKFSTIQLVLQETSPSPFLLHKKLSSVLTSMITECTPQAAKVTTLKVNFQFSKDQQFSNQPQSVINSDTVSSTSHP